MSIKPIVVDSAAAYTIPLTLSDGKNFDLKLREGFTMSNEDADNLLKYGVKMFKAVGKTISEAGVDNLLTEEQIESLSDQERTAYVNKMVDLQGGDTPLTESMVTRKLVAFAYDVTEEWLYKNTSPSAMSAIFEHVQEWIGIKNPKKS